jgi:hypothetical protein
MVGHSLIAFPIKSSRIITRVTPAGPKFFCAPANIRPYFDILIGFENKFDEQSAQIGMSPAFSLISSRILSLNSTPSIVSLSQI